jgi:hypothetical protein
MKENQTKTIPESVTFLKSFQTRKIVIDTKCSWSPETFMNAEPDVLYEAKEIFIRNYGMLTSFI